MAEAFAFMSAGSSQPWPLPGSALARADLRAASSASLFRTGAGRLAPWPRVSGTGLLALGEVPQPAGVFVGGSAREVMAAVLATVGRVGLDPLCVAANGASPAEALVGVDGQSKSRVLGTSLLGAGDAHALRSTPLLIAAPSPASFLIRTSFVSRRRVMRWTSRLNSASMRCTSRSNSSRRACCSDTMPCISLMMSCMLMWPGH
mmetsp:Transcript_81913/g.244258  ORF Transcript_81913/g.244258 Transcript_81913/m.244258 type:complete len:204 (+) Transcript_81913:1112-1723(+)